VERCLWSSQQEQLQKHAGRWKEERSRVKEDTKQAIPFQQTLLSLYHIFIHDDEFISSVESTRQGKGRIGQEQEAADSARARRLLSSFCILHSAQRFSKLTMRKHVYSACLSQVISADELPDRRIISFGSISCAGPLPTASKRFVSVS